MNLNRITSTETFFSQDKIKAWKVFTGKETEQILMILEPGAILQSHTTDFDVNFLMMYGMVQLNIENDSYLLEANDLAVCEGNISHGIHNNSNELSTVLITKIFKQK